MRCFSLAWQSLSITLGLLVVPSAAAVDFLGDLHKSTEGAGFLLSAEYTGEGLANFTGGLRTGAVYEGLLKLGLQLDLKTLADWNGGSIAASVLYPHGEGLTREYAGDFNVLSNITQYNSFRLFEFWFEQKLLNNLFSVRLGQMSADQEFWTSNTANLYINSAFGTFPTISQDTFLSNYPVGSLGLRVSYQPSQIFLLRAGVFDADPGLPNETNKHGTRFHLNPSSGLVGIAEAVFSVNSAPEAKGLPGTYKIGAIYDSHPAALIAHMHSGNYLSYVSIEQMLYRVPPVEEPLRTNGTAGNAQQASAAAPAPSHRGLFTFFRTSVAPQEDRNLVTFYIDGGFNFVGPLSSRPVDVLGVALSYAKISRDFRSSATGPAVRSGHETILEADYKLQLGDHFYLQPDLQYIFHPGAFENHDNAIAGGIRFDFTY